MLTLTGLLAAVLLARTASAAPGAPAPAPLQGTCRAVAPCVSTLRSYNSRTAFCSSWLEIKTRTSWATSTSSMTSTDTSTSTSTTGTTTVTADAVTFQGHGESIIAHFATETATDHITTTWAPTPTVTAHIFKTTMTETTTTVICGNHKRYAQSSKPIPSPLKPFQSSVISSGCSCLSLTTPTTTATTTTSVTTTTLSTFVLNVVATETTTPTTSMTYRTTSTPTGTTTVTPTTTLTPPAVTTTPTSTVTTTLTSTVRAGMAAVQLANPTPVIPVSGGRATQDWDDETGWRINNIPFDVGLYGVTSRTLIVGINGWVSPGSTDSGTYENTVLPNPSGGDPSWVPYWSDLYVTGGTTQGIYYEIDGDPGQRVLSIEYFMSFYHAPTAYTHFLVNLFENEVGRCVFTYFQTTSLHASLNPQLGTIGVQRPGTGQFNQYSYNSQPAQGLSIEWRPSTNQWRELTGGGC